MVLASMEKSSKSKKPAPSPPKQIPTKLPGKLNEPARTINWELNEKISLSSGSSTGIEIRADKRIGIGFTDRSKKSTNSSSDKAEDLNCKPVKALDLLQVSGLTSTKAETRSQAFKDNLDTSNVLRSDSKYEIGIPGECTISRKKRQERRKIDGTMKHSRNGDDLTGTVRRRWIPANEKIDDSIAKRLELIHELNQKILANYERIQSKSKKKSGSLKSTSRKSSESSKSRTALADLRSNKNHIYSEVIPKNREITNVNKVIERAIVHRVEEDSFDDKPLVTNWKETSKKVDNTETMCDTIALKASDGRSSLKVNENFSMTVKGEFEGATKSRTKGNSVKSNILNNSKSQNTNDTVFHIDEIKMKETMNRRNIGECPSDRNRLDGPKQRLESNMNTRNWKDELYTSLKQDQCLNKEKKIEKLNFNDDTKDLESTSNLEREILDNLNETIGRFDQDKISDETNVDEGTGEEEVDKFSIDSIQCTTPSSKVNGTKDSSNQETFNSSWDSGVGIDVGSGSGWVRIHTGIESSLVYLTLDTTTKDICRDMLLGDELSLYVQYGGEAGRRMSSKERPLELQDEFLKLLGFTETTRRARLGVDPELRHLIGFHVGPSGPSLDLTGHSRSGNVLVLKGLVFPQWKKRTLAVIGSRLFLYPGCPESQPEWIELNGGAVCYAPSRLGKLVLRVTGYPRIIQQNSKQLDDNSLQLNEDEESLSSDTSHHPDARHLYLGFHHPWDRDLWRGWLKQATQSTNCQKNLDLRKTGLTQIPESTLAFGGIEEILLGENNLGGTESNLGILKRFPRLRRIEVERNELKTIPREILELNRLTSLNLSDNRIEELPGDIHRLVNLKDLVLDRNGIKELPPEIQQLRELRSISIVGNKLTELPSFLKMRALTLEGLTKAETVKIKDEKNNQNNLHKVNLRNNQLKGNIILGNYGNLTHLDVSENSIEKLDVSALQELQSARCSSNSLIELTLCGRNLVSLIAGNNKLKKLTIEPVPMNLEHLDVSHNCLDTLPEWICDLPGLRALSASHNDLTALPDRLLSQPSRLEVLHLPHNRLQALPPPRKPLNILHLTLQGNALTALPTTFFQNTERMKVLNLSNNRLSELPYTEDTAKNRNPPALEKLYLTGNCLTDAALDALGKLSSLRVLHLAYNVMDTLPESCIASWSDLEELVLSGNRLQYLPDNVANLQHLRVLRVHSNRLLTCPTFNKTTSLMVLDLAHNQLDRVNLATLVPPQLQFLDISCNSRLHVDPRQFQVYRSQRPVSLIDVSGQNRPSLPSHPLQQEIVSGERGPEQPWRLGFSETAGRREKLYISQVRMPLFCNTEGLFGIFDGGNNQEAPSALQEMVPRLLLEEKTIRETSKDYMKYTLLSAHRELKEKGQKHGVDAALIHITRLPSPQNFSRAPKKYCLKIASSGETQAVLCRAAGPLLLAPPKKSQSRNQIGNAAMFPSVLPDPTSEEVALEDDDEFLIIANKKLWEVLTIQEAVREARAEASPVLAAKRLQDLAQAYGAEDNLSIIVVRLTGPGSGDLDQLMRELRQAVTKNRSQPEANCSCPCCVPPAPHKSPSACCCHANEGFYLNGVLKNIVNHRSGSSRPGSGRYFKNSRNTESASPPFRDDRSSPSGQSDQTTDSTFKSRQTSGRGWVGTAAARAASKNRQTVIAHDNPCRKEEASERSAALSEEQFRCWEYMLEQNTHMLFDKELDTITRIPLRRGQSRSTPQLANLPFLSKRFGSARSFNPPLPRAPMMRFGSGRRFLNGGPNAAYFGSLQRLMPYNLEYDFAVIQERGGLDSLEADSSRMQQYWGVATTEL